MNVNGVGVGYSGGVDSVNVSKTAEVKSDNLEKAVKKDVENKETKETKEKITPEKLDEALKSLNKGAEIVQSGLKFEKEEDAGEWVVKVIKVDDGEVIRQYPSEETLKIVKGIKEMLGAIFDKIV